MSLRRKLVHLGVAFLLKILDFGLNHFNYSRVTWVLLHLSPTPDPERQEHKRAYFMGKLVNSVGYHPRVNVSCLRRTLALWWLLRWNGIPSTVQIGVNAKAGHAWLEHHGMVVNDHPDVLTKYPGRFADELTPEKAAKLI
ncbi:MAG: lasso peptide biosynthesis B2 protein [Anaerolinea sp.]|nr:lasso peptide biosynthesis B2 protein [Anaerolinea sp.]